MCSVTLCVFCALQVVNDTQQPFRTCFVNPLAQNNSLNVISSLFVLVMNCCVNLFQLQVSIQLQQDLFSLVRFEAVISYLITSNQTQQHHVLDNIKHDIHDTSLSMITLVRLLHYTTPCYTILYHTHYTTYTLHCAHSLTYLLFFLQIHQLMPNIVNTIPPHHNTQCRQQLNITNILQSLIIQVNNTQQHLLTLLHNMEDDYSE